MAADCRVLVDGAGCRTRQLVIQKIWEKLPGVSEVLILPREEAPAANQRIFVIRCKESSPTEEQLVEALGRRAKFYHVIQVTAQGLLTETIRADSGAGTGRGSHRFDRCFCRSR